MLSRLALQAAAGVGRAETSLQEIEATFRDMIDMPTDLRRDAAPIVQLMPAGIITTKGFISKLGVITGSFRSGSSTRSAARRGRNGSQCMTTPGHRGGSVPDLHAGQQRSAAVRPVQRHSNRDTAHGWTLSQASLQVNLLIDVTIPTDYLFMLSPATVVVEDAQGRKFGALGADLGGSAGCGRRDRCSGAVPAPARRRPFGDGVWHGSGHVHARDGGGLPRPVGHAGRRPFDPGNDGRRQDRRWASHRRDHL